MLPQPHQRLLLAPSVPQTRAHLGIITVTDINSVLVLSSYAPLHERGLITPFHRSEDVLRELKKPDQGHHTQSDDPMAHSLSCLCSEPTVGSVLVADIMKGPALPVTHPKTSFLFPFLISPLHPFRSQVFDLFCFFKTLPSLRSS